MKQNKVKIGSEDTTKELILTESKMKNTSKRGIIVL